MKDHYMKLITKNFSKELKPFMRQALKELYSPDSNFGHCISEHWVSDDPENDTYIIEDSLAELLYECAKKKYKFGDYTITVTDSDDGSAEPLKTYRTLKISVPVE